MKTAHKRFQEFQSAWGEYWKNTGKNSNKDETQHYFEKLEEAFSCDHSTIMNMWYARQRSWYNPKMMDVILDMGQNPDNYDFRPVLQTGNFDWDEENSKFIKVKNKP